MLASNSFTCTAGMIFKAPKCWAPFYLASQTARTFKLASILHIFVSAGVCRICWLKWATKSRRLLQRITQDIFFYLGTTVCLCIAVNCGNWIAQIFSYYILPGEGVFVGYFTCTPEPITSYCLPYAQRILGKFCVIVYNHF